MHPDRNPIRVDVKTIKAADRPRQYSIRRGKTTTFREYSAGDCDLFALVCLEDQSILFDRCDKYHGKSSIYINRDTHRNTCPHESWLSATIEPWTVYTGANRVYRPPTDRGVIAWKSPLVHSYFLTPPFQRLQFVSNGDITIGVISWVLISFISVLQSKRLQEFPFPSKRLGNTWLRKGLLPRSKQSMMPQYSGATRNSLIMSNE